MKVIGLYVSHTWKVHVIFRFKIRDFFPVQTFPVDGQVCVTVVNISTTDTLANPFTLFLFFD